MKGIRSVSIIHGVVAALLIGALVTGSGCAVGSSSPDNPPTPTFTLTPTALNFGNQPVNTTSSPQSVTLTNVGSLDVVISSVNITSAVFGVSGPAAPVTVRPGNSVVYNVTFRPSAAQSYSGSLSFASNAPSSPSSVSLSGTGVAGTTVLNVSPTSINFGNQAVNTTSSPRSVVATNAGTTSITISNVSTNLPFAVSGFGGSTTLNPGQSLNLSVTFTPTAETSYTGTLSITSTAPGSPHTVSLTGTGVAPPPPPPTCGSSPLTSYTVATTDRSTRSEPALPAVGPAGTIITDPTFGMRILRLTDQSTPVIAPRFQVPSSAHAKMFNCDDTRVVAASENGELRAWDLNPTTTAITFGGSVPLLGDAPFFSYVNPDKLYGIVSGTNDIGVYDFNTSQTTTLLDPDALALPGFTGQRAQIVGVSRDDRYIGWFGSGVAQEDDRYVIRYDQTSGEWRALNSQTGQVFQGVGNSPGTLVGTVDAIPGNTMHNARMSVDGQFFVIRGTASGGDGHWDANSPLNYNILTFFGHFGQGYMKWVIHCQFSDGADWCVDPYMESYNSPNTIHYPATKLTPAKFVIDNHPSWLNDAPGMNVPICLATFSDDTVPDRAWEDEVICIATGTPDGDTVWRFAHIRAGNTWETIPRGNVSQSGRFFMFQSHWEGTLAGGRTDVFIVELR